MILQTLIGFLKERLPKISENTIYIKSYLKKDILITQQAMFIIKNI